MVIITNNNDYIWLASVAIYKKYTKQQMLESMYMKGIEDHIEHVWKIVEETKEKGEDWFYSKFKAAKLYKINQNLN